MKSIAVMGTGELEKRILTLRGEKVMIDSDLAKLYGVSTKRLNEQVRRNKERFPSDFMFRLTAVEKAEVVAMRPPSEAEILTNHAAANSKAQKNRLLRSQIASSR